MRPCSLAGKEIELTAGAKKCERCGSKATRKNRKYSGTIRHDMRRSAAKEARLAVVPESTIMDMGGWKTRSVFKRYDDRQQRGSDSRRSKIERARAEKLAQYTEFTQNQAKNEESENTEKNRATATRPN